MPGSATSCTRSSAASIPRTSTSTQLPPNDHKRAIWRPKTTTKKGCLPSSPKSKVGACRWYGAARGLAIVLPFELVLLPMAAIVSDFLPLAVAVGAALICWVAPARPHVGKSARVGDSAWLAWFFAVVHLLILGFWVYFSTGFFGLLFNAKFKAAVKDADRIVVRDGGGLCHSDLRSLHSLKSLTRWRSRRSTKCSGLPEGRCLASAVVIRV